MVNTLSLMVTDNRNNVYLAALQHLGLEIESFATSSERPSSKERGNNHFGIGRGLNEALLGTRSTAF